MYIINISWHTLVCVCEYKHCIPFHFCLWGHSDVSHGFNFKHISLSLSLTEIRVSKAIQHIVNCPKEALLFWLLIHDWWKACFQTLFQKHVHSGKKWVIYGKICMIQTFSTGYIYCSQKMVSQSCVKQAQLWSKMDIHVFENNLTHVIVLLCMTNCNSAWQE